MLYKKFGCTLLIAVMVVGALSSVSFSQEKTGTGLTEKSREITAELLEIETRINNFQPNPQFKDDRFALITLKEAIIAAKEGNYGIGACLVRESTGEIVEKGHNKVFKPYFRSDRHAEMVTMTAYEDRVQAERSQVEGLVLYTSLECCPMCLTRLISAGIQKIYYIAPDPIAGMIHLYDNMPPLWQVIGLGRTYAQAQCSPELKKLANEVFVITRQELDAKLQK